METIKIEQAQTRQIGSSHAAGNEVEVPRSEQAAVRPPLYRHPVHRLIGGVCGGIGDYLNIDPTLVRVLWVVLTLGTAGAGFLAYLALWLLLPVGTARTGMQEPAAFELNERNVQRAGMLLIGLGVLWLLSNLGILPWLWSAFWSVVGVVFWPALLIGAGLLLLKNQREWQGSLRGWGRRLHSSVRGRRDGVKVDRHSLKNGLLQLRERIPFKRSRNDRILLGLCGGIGQTFGIDSNLVRLFWILFSIGSIGTGVLVYVIIGLLLPQRPADAGQMVYEQEPQNVQIIDGTAS